MLLFCARQLLLHAIFEFGRFTWVQQQSPFGVRPIVFRAHAERRQTLSTFCSASLRDLASVSAVSRHQGRHVGGCCPATSPSTPAATSTPCGSRPVSSAPSRPYASWLIVLQHGKNTGSSKVECRKHNDPVGGGNFVSAWSRIGASHSNFFICVYASMYFFLSVLLFLTTFTAMTARDDVGRFALLTDVDGDTLSVPGPRLQRPGQPQLQGQYRACSFAYYLARHDRQATIMQCD